MKILLSLSFLLFFTMSNCKDTEVPEELISYDVAPNEENSISLNQILYQKIEYSIEENTQTIKELNEELHASSNNVDEIINKITLLEEQNESRGDQLINIADDLEERGRPVPGGEIGPCIACPGDVVAMCCYPDRFMFLNIDISYALSDSKEGAMEALAISQEYSEAIELFEFEESTYFFVDINNIDSDFSMTILDSNETPHTIPFDFSGE